MIIGIDPSLTHLGWVLFDENKTGRDAVLETGLFKTGPTDGLLVQRLIMQKERLRLLLSSHSIKFVAMEAPIMKDWSTELLYALHQYLHEVFLDLKVFLVYFQPLTVKRYAYPDLKSDEISKALMTLAAKKELNKIGKRFSEHIADAYFIGKIGLKFYQWFFLHKYTDKDLSERERQLFCGKHLFTRGNKKGLTEYTGIIYRENEQFFDFSKQTRDSITIIKEIQNGV
jgi:Holliday junction resolvasome RuvABC endonuclease subunit